MEQDFAINCDCIRFLSVSKRKNPHKQRVADDQERDGSILIGTSASFAAFGDKKQGLAVVDKPESHLHSPIYIEVSPDDTYRNKFCQ